MENVIKKWVLTLSLVLGSLTISAQSNKEKNLLCYESWEHKGITNVIGKMEKDTKIDLRDFTMPTEHRKVTSSYGKRWGRIHQGVDVKVYIGDTIRSAFEGKVRIVNYDSRGYGYYVVIRHPNGLETLYGHLSKQLVKENQEIKCGEPIGLGGNSGRSTGSHLHFEVRILGKSFNPSDFFDFEHQDIVQDFYNLDEKITKCK